MKSRLSCQCFPSLVRWANSQKYVQETREFMKTLEQWCRARYWANCGAGKDSADCTGRTDVDAQNHVSSVRLASHSPNLTPQPRAGREFYASCTLRGKNIFLTLSILRVFVRSAVGWSTAFWAFSLLVFVPSRGITVVRFIAVTKGFWQEVV